MIRFTMLAVALFVLTGASNVRSQDSDEVKRLKVKVELLEAKLETAKLKIEKLQKENEQLKASEAKDAVAKPVADDGFGVGTKLAGPYTKTWVENGNRMNVGEAWEFEVTKRSGKEFTASVYHDDRKGGVEVEGTIDKGEVKFKVTKYLTEARNSNAVGNTVFKGQLKKGTLTGKVTKPKADSSYQGEVRLKVSTE